MIIIGDTMELGQIIRKRRKEKKISQKEFAKPFGLYDSDISKFERGKEDIYLSRLAKWVKILDLDMLDVLVESGYISEESVTKHQIIPWEGLAYLTEDDIKYIRRFADALIEARKGEKL